MKTTRLFPSVIMILIILVITTGMRPLSPSSIITVNTYTDDYGTGATCSLREAITASIMNSTYAGCTAGTIEPDTISLPQGIYSLTIEGDENLNAQGDIDINQAINILGPAGTLTIIGQGTGAIIDAGGSTGIQDRIFDIFDGMTVTIENLTITGGSAPDGDGDVPDGGGIRSNGVLSLINVTVSNNQAGQGAGGNPNGASGGSGGGIHSGGPTLSIVNSTIIGNSAGAGEGGKPSGFGGQGGGIYTDGSITSISGSVISNNMAGVGGASSTTASGGSGGGMYLRGVATITTSTISGNTAGSSSTSYGGRGGGIYANSMTTIINTTISGNTSGTSTDEYGGPGHGGGVVASSDMIIRYSTITDNHIGTGTYSGFGGGIFSEGSDYLTLGATIVAGNMDDDDIYPDCYQNGVITSEDYNLIGDTRGCTLSVTPANNILDPVGFSLPPLGNFGGLTQTHPLPSGNPAVDQIPNGTSGCGTTYTTDQRNETRPVFGLCDVGAYEMQAMLNFLPLILK